MSDVTPNQNLPGLVLARQVLTAHREDAEDLDFLKQELDLEQGPLTGDAALITPGQALDALMILRFFKGHAQAGAPPLAPARGSITRIITPQPDESKRLKTLLKTRMRDMLAMGETGPQNPDPEDIELIRHAGAEASRADTARCIEVIETAMLAGDPVIVILSGTDPLGEALRGLVGATLRLAPPDAQMLAAILGILHKSEIDPATLPRSGIEDLRALQLAQVLAARTADDAVALLDRICADRTGEAPVTLDHVHGQSEAKEAFTQLQADLEDWRHGRLPWLEVTSSFLLFGPPGTGKTHLASALAGSARLPLVKTSYSDCQKAGHQGDMLRELNAAADRAISQTPAVFFLDEIDSFFSRNRPSNGYILGVVNGLLTLLDRLNATPGVIVMGATNYPQSVDPAILRSGRLDRHIPVGPLDRAGVRAALLAGLPEGLLPDPDLCLLADQLAGHVGADLASLLRDARTQARRAGTGLAAQHVKTAADRLSPRPEPDLQRRIAIHEAGHMLAGHIFGLPVPRRAQLNARNGFIATPDFDILTHARICAQIRTDLGGYVAEQLVFGAACSGSGGDVESDLARATFRAQQAELSYGFGETLSWQPSNTEMARLSARQRARIEQQLQQALQETQQALLTHRADLERIADLLIRERELDRGRIAELLREVPVAEPSSDPRKAPGRNGHRLSGGSATHDCNGPE
ncbi:AAA family ATPase [Roseinatronobacter monicus]|uniref:ATP-dependent Zn protease n=1 Tax=Roseinatronobacter monicus TaxID=393481 RepID=A0A543K8Q9_9RHOB|nr:AAA family ATPase [Roseinatronobacter monicus]TQM91470.1 ATP-dependent Zn protease [Roseinatronobacter monicus]